MSADHNEWSSLTDVEFSRIDAWCDLFEARWRAGYRPSIDTIVASAPEPVRAYLRRELEQLESELQAKTDAVMSSSHRPIRSTAAGENGRTNAPAVPAETAHRGDPPVIVPATRTPTSHGRVCLPWVAFGVFVAIVLAIVWSWTR